MPRALRNNYYTDLCDTIDEEYSLFRTDFTIPLNNVYDIASMDYDRLREVSAQLGVLFDASIDGTIEFLRQEVYAIPFKIFYKSTVRLYKSFFRSLGRVGEIYIYYYKGSSQALVKNGIDLLLDLATHDPATPYRHRSSEQFTGSVETSLRLDTGLYLDIEVEDSIWTLDTVDSLLATNHTGLEFVLNQIITKEVNGVDTEFLMTREYFDFIQVNHDFTRRVKEVPHIGCQLTALVDPSATYDFLSDNYTVPLIKMKALSTKDFSSVASVLGVSYIEFGIGSHTNLRSKDGTGAIPSDLDQRVARSTILFDEKYENGDYIGVTGEYRGQQINYFVVHDGTGYKLSDSYGSGATNGTNNDFQGTLLFAPIQPGNVRFIIYHDDIRYIIEDDQKGNLLGDIAYGTIDYTTGKYQFSTDINYRAEDVVATGDGVETDFDITLDLPNPILTTTGDDPNDPHFWIIYNIDDHVYITKDDGLGNISGTKIVSGTIDYEHGTVSLEFEEPLTNEEDLVFKYRYRKVSTPDAESEIRVDYYFTVQSIEITEAGLFDEYDEMIAYATFPPIEFTSSRYHLSMNFIVKKLPY